MGYQNSGTWEQGISTWRQTVVTLTTHPEISARWSLYLWAKPCATSEEGDIKPCNICERSFLSNELWAYVWCVKVCLGMRVHLTNVRACAIQIILVSMQHLVVRIGTKNTLALAHTRFLSKWNRQLSHNILLNFLSFFLFSFCEGLSGAHE